MGEVLASPHLCHRTWDPHMPNAQRLDLWLPIVGFRYLWPQQVIMFHFWIPATEDEPCAKWGGYASAAGNCSARSIALTDPTAPPRPDPIGVCLMFVVRCG